MVSHRVANLTPDPTLVKLLLTRIERTGTSGRPIRGRGAWSAAAATMPVSEPHRCKPVTTNTVSAARQDQTTMVSSGQRWRERAPAGEIMFRSPMKTPARKSDVQGFGSMLIDMPVSKRTGRLGQWASSPGIVM